MKGERGERLCHVPHPCSSPWLFHRCSSLFGCRQWRINSCCTLSGLPVSPKRLRKVSRNVCQPMWPMPRRTAAGENIPLLHPPRLPRFLACLEGTREDPVLCLSNSLVRCQFRSCLSPWAAPRSGTRWSVPSFHEDLGSRLPFFVLNRSRVTSGEKQIPRNSWNH